MSWRASSRHPVTQRINTWSCDTVARLQVRLREQPASKTAYLIVIDGIERPELGAHRWLADAQHAAEQAITHHDKED
jgi:hypothetical protein